MSNATSSLSPPPFSLSPLLLFLGQAGRRLVRRPPGQDGRGGGQRRDGSRSLEARWQPGEEEEAPLSPSRAKATVPSLEYEMSSVTWGVIQGRKERLVSRVLALDFLQSVGFCDPAGELEAVELPSSLEVLQERLDFDIRLGLSTDNLSSYPLLPACSLRKNAIPVLSYLEAGDAEHRRAAMAACPLLLPLSHSVAHVVIDEEVGEGAIAHVLVDEEAVGALVAAAEQAHQVAVALPHDGAHLSLELPLAVLHQLLQPLHGNRPLAAVPQCPLEHRAKRGAEARVAAACAGLSCTDLRQVLGVAAIVADEVEHAAGIEAQGDGEAYLERAGVLTCGAYMGPTPTQPPHRTKPGSKLPKDLFVTSFD
uniref:Uncharacterized protein n=1 Tax=Oryza barthii TaxID=65489 RepID=A0A0D3G6M0_9ORYZ